jgi:catalase
LLNIDETLAGKVAHALGLKEMPQPAPAAVPTRQDLDASPKLSIIENGPKRFEGRKLGILVTDGTDATLLNALISAVTAEKAVYEIIAPKITGVRTSDGKWVEAHQKIDGGPSVLYDAVAVLPSADMIADLVKESAARDFVADAFAHCKFIAYSDAAMPLLEKAGIADNLDQGVMKLGAEKDVKAFVGELGKLRVWGREPGVKL